MFTLFSGHHIHVGTAAWHFHTGLCKFLCNLSMNIWSLRKCSHLKLREVSSLCIFYTVQLRYKRTTHIHIIWAYFAYTCMSIHAHIRVYMCVYVSFLCIPKSLFMWSIVSQTKETYFLGMKMLQSEICILLKHNADQWKLSYFEYSITLQIHSAKLPFIKTCLILSY